MTGLFSDEIIGFMVSGGRSLFTLNKNEINGKIAIKVKSEKPTNQGF
jgi:hypothetical protein